VRIFDQIIKLLDQAKMEYQLVEHLPARTSQEATAVTGWPLSCGAKSILFKTPERFVLCVVRGTSRADYRKLRQILSVRKIRLATAEEVLSVMGVAVGACYPFPQLVGLQGYVDYQLRDCSQISFSPGTATHHIRMSYRDYLGIADVSEADLTIDG